jgi:hypothetical protein
MRDRDYKLRGFKLIADNKGLDHRLTESASLTRGNGEASPVVVMIKLI